MSPNKTFSHDDDLIKITSLPEFYQELSRIKFDDPHSVYVSRHIKKLSIGEGTRIGPHVYFIGNISIGPGCIIGPETYIKDSEMGRENRIRFSYIVSTLIGEGNVIGPQTLIEYANIGDRNEFGFTTQIKRCHFGDENTAKHHCYIGNARVGNRVNFGAGFVTCNYDGGAEKKITIIEDGAFPGVNVNAIAPIRIGRESYSGAGSTIKTNVPPHAVVVGGGGLGRILKNKKSRRTDTGWTITEE